MPEDDYIEFYLQNLRTGHHDTAFHALREAGPSIIPRLIETFRHEKSAPVRAELVAIIWNFKVPETVNFLGEALNDADPGVWKNALDGLVTMASPASLKVLEGAAVRANSKGSGGKDFLRWVNEASEQVRDLIEPKE